MDTVNAEIEVEPVPLVVTVDLKNAYTADVAAARTLRKISQKCTDMDIKLKIINVNVGFLLADIQIQTESMFFRIC